MTYHAHPMENLIGLRIKAIHVSDGEQELVIETDAGPLGWVAYGDCCSETWFADITGVSSLLDATVTGIEELALAGYDTEDGRGRQETDEAYGYQIKTDRGSGDVIFRNSSNGYYGGNIERIAEPSPEGLKTITQDWRA